MSPYYVSKHWCLGIYLTYKSWVCLPLEKKILLRAWVHRWPRYMPNLLLLKSDTPKCRRTEMRGLLCLLVCVFALSQEVKMFLLFVFWVWFFQVLRLSAILCATPNLSNIYSLHASCVHRFCCLQIRSQMQGMSTLWQQVQCLLPLPSLAQNLTGVVHLLREAYI